MTVGPITIAAGHANHSGGGLFDVADSASSEGLPVPTSRTSERTERTGPPFAALLAGLAAIAAGLILAASIAVLALSDGSGARPPTTPD